MSKGDLLAEIDFSDAVLKFKEADAAVKGAEARLKDLKAVARK